MITPAEFESLLLNEAVRKGCLVDFAASDGLGRVSFGSCHIDLPDLRSLMQLEGYDRAVETIDELVMADSN